MRNRVVRVKNFIITHRAPIAFAAGIYVGANAMQNAQEWKELLDTAHEIADSTEE